MRKALVAVSIGVIALAACGRSEPDSGEATQARDSGAAIEINTFMFMPKDLQVSVGTKVTWTNSDAILHTVTSGTRRADAQGQPVDVRKDGRFDLQLDGKGQSGSYTFTDTGTFTYFCDRHPGMDAAVTVN